MLDAESRDVVAPVLDTFKPLDLSLLQSTLVWLLVRFCFILLWIALSSHTVLWISRMWNKWDTTWFDKIDRKNCIVACISVREQRSVVLKNRTKNKHLMMFWNIDVFRGTSAYVFTTLGLYYPLQTPNQQYNAHSLTRLQNNVKLYPMILLRWFFRAMFSVKRNIC
jgi:hypothetical protein